MPLNLTVTFDPDFDPTAKREWGPLDIVDAPPGRPMKFVAKFCCEHAHLKMDGADVVTCCHAGHPSFMIRDGKVVGTSA